MSRRISPGSTANQLHYTSNQPTNQPATLSNTVRCLSNVRIGVISGQSSLVPTKTIQFQVVDWTLFLEISVFSSLTLLIVEMLFHLKTIMRVDSFPWETNLTRIIVFQQVCFSVNCCVRFKGCKWIRLFWFSC